MPGSRPIPPFRSFWMGGFEGADHLNGAGDRLDMVQATGHDQRLQQDYRRARLLGLRTVRESIGWRLVENAEGRFDFSRALRMAEAARREGVQILWTLMHYGVPQGLSLLDDALVPRFARFAGAAAQALAPVCPGPRFYTPINEISFLSWAAASGDTMGPAGVPPHHQTPAITDDSSISGFQIKRRLVRAALAGMAAIRAADPHARFLHVEPVLHVAPPVDQPEQLAQAERISAFQWQALDMLAGRMEPELGGHPEALDWLGLNHYHSSQWEIPSEKRLSWHLRDPRRRPLAALMDAVWHRYRRPLVIAETGHMGVGRAQWLHEVAGEALRARARGIPLGGVCLYPLLDRPDWHELSVWHRSGLWHVPNRASAAPSCLPLPRRLHKPYAKALLAWACLNDPQALAGITPDGSDSCKPGLTVLLPQPWETWPARHQTAALALAEHFVLRLIEPPRHWVGAPVIRRFTLAPHAELLVMHRPAMADTQMDASTGRGIIPGSGAVPGSSSSSSSSSGKDGVRDAEDGHGWQVAPDADTLAMLQQDRESLGSRRWWCWIWSCPPEGVHPGWAHALAGEGLIHHPREANTSPASALAALVRLRLPADWPPPHRPLRRHVPDGYEQEEASRLLTGATQTHGHRPPTAWLQAADTPPLDLQATQAHALRTLARQHPGWQLLVDAAPPTRLNGEADPPNLRWMGPLHPVLHATLVAAVEAALPWTLWSPLTEDLPALSALCRAALAVQDASQRCRDARRVQEAQQRLTLMVAEALRGRGIAPPAHGEEINGDEINGQEISTEARSAWP